MLVILTVLYSSVNPYYPDGPHQRRKPMKIDTHQHFWHYRPQDLPWIGEHMPPLRRDRLPADNQEAMQACGVDAVMAVQTGAGQKRPISCSSSQRKTPTSWAWSAGQI